MMVRQRTRLSCHGGAVAGATHGTDACKTALSRYTTWLSLSSTMLAILIACNARPSADKMIVRQPLVNKTIGNKIFVDQATGGGENDILSPTIIGEVKISNEEFTQAVESSIRQARLFSEYATKFEEEWGLRVLIVHVETNADMLSATMLGKVTARYSVFYKNNPAYEFELQTTGMAQDFLGSYGSLRKEAVEKATQENIAQFLSNFANYDFSDIADTPVSDKLRLKKKVRIVGRIFQVYGRKVDILTATGPLKVGKIYTVLHKERPVGLVRVDTLFHTKCTGKILRGAGTVAADMRVAQ